MYILGIESSCDETAVAVIEREEQDRVIVEQIKSQVPLHAKYGGVVPEIASRNHYEVIDYLTLEVLKKAGITIDDIHLIALTLGPGLMGSLLVGLSFAKGLAFANKIPLAAVDHVHAHIESAFIDHPGIRYPLVALVVSGGHTTLFYQKSKFETEVLAKTRDDAVGEVLDKVSKFYHLGYPGGPILDKLYKGGDPNRYSFTFPRMSDGSDDFSFSGYKTAAIRHPAGKNPNPEDRTFKDLIASFLNSVVDYLLTKTQYAVEKANPRSLIVAGGVSRNSLLREKFTNAFTDSPVKLYLASPRYCTDNAAMAAWLGYEKYRHFPNINYFDNYLNSYSRASFRDRGPKYR
ncbi:MAG: tRNA (adenosine(37)-N6)-threonylcarbamoyltransferase complex transferase subunit TsaD [Candidatus Aminicenantes bacterium]|nr:MAG: tRNA (adenosine(37)-N6)-threonylcarbamoyltransferase complex transferase subunit TsaD [Candidatus Aminicenantes bacterium]